MPVLWISWSIWSLVSLAAAIAVAGFMAPSRKTAFAAFLGAYVAAAALALAAAGEAAIATISLAPEPTTTLAEGNVVALIYREGYSYTLDGERFETKGGWYLKVGKTAPDKPSTDIAPFATLGEGAKVITHPGTPGSTIRQSIKDLPEQPLQICTGACEDIARIPDGAMMGQPGIVVSDWMRVQQTKLGQRALAPVAAQPIPPEPLSAGRWMLSIGLVLALSAGIATGLKHTFDGRPADKPKIVRKK